MAMIKLIVYSYFVLSDEWIAARTTSVVRMFGLFFFVSTFLSAQTDSIAFQLAQAERDFAKSAGSTGIRSAFLANLDDQSVVFYPRPVNAKETISAEGETPGSLVWSPVVVEVSSSGDLGFTTGPSEYRSGDSTDNSVHYGCFVSMWKKNIGGAWKVILDIGLGYPEHARREEKVRVRQLHQRFVDRSATQESARSSLLRSDLEFSQAETEKGTDVALVKFATEDVRVYRPGFFPAEGSEQIRAVLKDEKLARFTCTDGQVSGSGDIGFTYGLAVDATSDTSNCVRIWRKENSWKVVVDLLKPWKPKK